MEPWEYAAWWFEGDGAKLANEIYNKQNIQVLLCSTIGPETAGWYRNPITSLADLKGLKIRFSGLGGMVLNEIGASATLMAGGEIFAALEKGTLFIMYGNSTRSGRHPGSGPQIVTIRVPCFSLENFGIIFSKTL